MPLHSLFHSNDCPSNVPPNIVTLFERVSTSYEHLISETNATSRTDRKQCTTSLRETFQIASGLIQDIFMENDDDAWATQVRLRHGSLDLNSEPSRDSESLDGLLGRSATKDRSSRDRNDASLSRFLWDERTLLHFASRSHQTAPSFSRAHSFTHFVPYYEACVTRPEHPPALPSSTSRNNGSRSNGGPALPQRGWAAVRLRADAVRESVVRLRMTDHVFFNYHGKTSRIDAASAPARWALSGTTLLSFETETSCVEVGTTSVTSLVGGEETESSRVRLGVIKAVRLTKDVSCAVKLDLSCPSSVFEESNPVTPQTCDDRSDEAIGPINSCGQEESSPSAKLTGHWAYSASPASPDDCATEHRAWWGSGMIPRFMTVSLDSASSNCTTSLLWRLWSGVVGSFQHRSDLLLSSAAEDRSPARSHHFAVSLECRHTPPDHPTTPVEEEDMPSTGESLLRARYDTQLGMGLIGATTCHLGSLRRWCLSSDSIRSRDALAAEGTITSDRNRTWTDFIWRMSARVAFGAFFRTARDFDLSFSVRL